MATSFKNDVTSVVHKAVEKMISRAVIKKKKEFVTSRLPIDLERCHDYIDQQIELIPPEKSASKDVIYRNICVVRNGTVLTFEIPVWEGKTYVPLGEQVYNVQLTLRARKNAQLKVHHSKSAIP